MFDFTRHFLSNCVRILGLEHHQVTGGFLAVNYGGRTVTVRVSHIGVTPSEWQRDESLCGGLGRIDEAVQATTET